MSVEENKVVVQKIFDGLSKGNLTILDECLAENFVRHGVGFPDMDREGYKQLLAGMIVPDFHSTVDEMVAEGDNVAFRCTHRLTHNVPLMGAPPTGKQITMTEAYFSRFENGKVAEWWALADMLGLQQQLAPPAAQD